MTRKDSGPRFLVIVAALVVIVAGLRAARALVVPFLLALFFAVILTPPLRWLQRKGLPTALALVIVIGSVALMGAFVALLVGHSQKEFTQNLPQYQKAIGQQWDEIHGTLSALGLELPRQQALPEEPSSEPPDSTPDPFPALDPQASGADPDRRPETPSQQPADRVEERANQPAATEKSTDFAMQLVMIVLREVGGILSNAVVILVTVIFMLLEASRFPIKLHAVLGEQSATLTHLETIVTNIRRYMVIKTSTSLLTGVLVTTFLLVLHVKYPFLWGLFAFLLNYVPNIGSILAAVPPVLIVLVGGSLAPEPDPITSPTSAAVATANNDSGPTPDSPDSGSDDAEKEGNQLAFGWAAVTGFGFVVINCFISYAIEPRFMGQGLGLSTLIVFMSLVFWGWVLGPTGMLLSAPLTMSLKIALQNYDDTRWIAVLMGSKAPKGAGENGRQAQPFAA